MSAGFLAQSHCHLIGIHMSNPDHPTPKAIGLIIDQATKTHKWLGQHTPEGWKLHYQCLPTVLWIHYWFVVAAGSPDKLMRAIKWITRNVFNSLPGLGSLSITSLPSFRSPTHRQDLGEEPAPCSIRSCPGGKCFVWESSSSFKKQTVLPLL